MLGKRGRFGPKSGFAILLFAALALAIMSQPAKRMMDFDQSFYLTIAYDLARHGVFSNGPFDAVDSTRAAPPPGMFFAPLYPSLVAGVMRLDTRFAAAVACSVTITADAIRRRARSMRHRCCSFTRCCSHWACWLRSGRIRAVSISGLAVSWDLGTAGSPRGPTSGHS